jgi:hypothetical protein
VELKLSEHGRICLVPLRASWSVFNPQISVAMTYILQHLTLKFLNVSYTTYLCIVYGSYNKQCLLPHTTSAGWFLGGTLMYSDLGD